MRLERHQAVRQWLAHVEFCKAGDDLLAPKAQLALHEHAIEHVKQVRREADPLPGFHFDLHHLIIIADSFDRFEQVFSGLLPIKRIFRRVRKDVGPVVVLNQVLHHVLVQIDILLWVAIRVEPLQVHDDFRSKVVFVIDELG